jgi:hypothetical protein
MRAHTVDREYTPQDEFVMNRGSLPALTETRSAQVGVRACPPASTRVSSG